MNYFEGTEKPRLLHCLLILSLKIFVIKLLADQNIFQIEEFIPQEVNLSLFNPNDALLNNIEDYSALFIRTVTKINKHALPDNPGNLSFIGTASSGIDHVDTEFLDSLGITFASAAGCNARAVAEYIATALLLWAESRSVDLKNYTVGVVGVGHVGIQIRKLLAGLSINTILYDPPREKRDASFTSSALSEVLDADILTFHVPLNRTGEYATYHWLNEEKLNGRKYELVINASRGGVIDEQALWNHYQKKEIKDYILDVWEDEPSFSTGMAENAYIATPHIAGYSYQAKQNATRMICESLCGHFGLTMRESSQLEKSEEITAFNGENHSLSTILSNIHPIMEYDRSLRQLFNLLPLERSKAFRNLRVDHPFRTEYLQINIPQGILEKYPVLSELGIRKI